MEIQKYEKSEDLIQIVKIRENSEFGKKTELASWNLKNAKM